jgi:hypothetical protein
MGALHQIERTQQLAPHADVALNHVRGALAQLQAQHANHPAVSQALEAVATSLSLVHTLSRMANGPAPGAQAAPPPAAHAQPPAGPPKTAAMAQKAPVQHAPPQHQPPPQQQQQGVAYAQTAQAQPMQPPQRMSNPQPSFPQGGGHAAPAQAAHGGMVARDPFTAPGGPAPQPPPGFHQAPQAPLGQPARASMPVPSPPTVGGNVQMVNADLGAHSPTNFYKGLSGNDIIDHGGLFVSTYVLPKIGAPVRLKVSLPGGYEFEANAIVKWTREDGGGDAPPGLGAQFTGITPEARQLVYRYVRNREPLFHDDF